ncbi:hypothetical protein GSI_12961 [Ganoderma sinense ZZ0214-1]|uniref:Transporter n=1 Tax=Ganoderma sinense ZZ0214-1 TaxID=1077348 RepID=A0A2G8RU78_9APHY|nr:hypothetical protein GSI_12961 [Ganoderma sinense ZZ0214-1]
MIAVLVTVLIAFLIAQAIAAVGLILTVREVAKALPSRQCAGPVWDGGPLYPYDTLAGLDEDDASFANLQQLPTDIPNYAISDNDDYLLPDDE